MVAPWGMLCIAALTFLVMGGNSASLRDENAPSSATEHSTHDALVTESMGTIIRRLTGSQVFKHDPPTKTAEPMVTPVGAEAISEEPVLEVLANEEAAASQVPGWAFVLVMVCG